MKPYTKFVGRLLFEGLLCGVAAGLILLAGMAAIKAYV